MEITSHQFKLIEGFLPVPRGNVKIPNLQVLKIRKRDLQKAQ